ncbi:hypothetical protein RCS94_10780 [Orbaceae bacterium ac157xtp]
MIAPSSYGALSATSANTIQGSRPGFTGQSGAKKLGFKVGNITYSEANDVYDSLTNPDKDKIISGVRKDFNGSLKLSDFVVTGLTANDFSPTTDYYDADGDAGYPTAADTFSMGSVIYNWYENGKDPDNDAPISVTNQTLGCGSGLSLPLTLKITLPNVKVKSRYGNPRESIPTPLIQKYKIGTATGICFAKPNQMIVDYGHTWLGTNGSNLFWNNASYKNRHPTSGGGYDSNQFDPVNGFKASLSTKFPTTGFPKASFTLIMTSNARDYTFSVLKPDGSLLTDGSVIVDTTGKVTLNSKPIGAVTIQAIYKNDTSQVHSYTFNPTSVWVVPKGTTRMNYASAKSACGVESKIPSRAELTNSPAKTGYEGASSMPVNAFTRAVGGGVFGEWGWIGGTSGTYPGSQWNSGWNWYWTRDPYTSGRQFRVASTNGYVDWGYPGISNSVACLE